MKKLAPAKRNSPFPERVRTLRRELVWTREEFKRKLESLHGAGAVSISTLIKMEKVGRDSYKLPKRPGKSPSLIEMVADTLSVDIGYLLAGFPRREIENSIFGARLEMGEILLVHDLAPRDREPFTDFLKSLPTKEADLLSLKLHSYRNERAFAVISRLERIYSGFEMLVVNEPPLMFWDDEDVLFWARNMELDKRDSADLINEFASYRQYFQPRAKNNSKIYKVVLKLQTFRRFLEHKSPENITKQINKMIEFLDYESFNMVLLEPELSQTLRQRDNELDEYEIISKHKIIPSSLEDSLSVQIQQTPPDHKPVEYFVRPFHPSIYFLSLDKTRIDNLWAKALDQYRRSLHPQEQLTAEKLRKTSKTILEQLRDEFIGL